MEKFEKFTEEELKHLSFVLHQYSMSKTVDHSIDVDLFVYGLATAVNDTIKQRTAEVKEASKQNVD